MSFVLRTGTNDQSICCLSLCLRQKSKTGFNISYIGRMCRVCLTRFDCAFSLLRKMYTPNLFSSALIKCQKNKTMTNKQKQKQRQIKCKKTKTETTTNDELFHMQNSVFLSTEIRETLRPKAKGEVLRTSHDGRRKFRKLTTEKSFECCFWEEWNPWPTDYWFMCSDNELQETRKCKSVKRHSTKTTRKLWKGTTVVVVRSPYLLTSALLISTGVQQGISCCKVMPGIASVNDTDCWHRPKFARLHDRICSVKYVRTAKKKQNGSRFWS